MTTADIDLLVSAAYRPGQFFCERCDTSLYGAVDAHGRMPCGCGPVTPVAADARRARLLDVAADACEDLGLDDRAADLRWRAVFDRLPAFPRVPFCFDSGEMRLQVFRASIGVNWRDRWYSLRRNGRGWEVGGRLCSPPACAAAVLAALRQALAGGGPHA